MKGNINIDYGRLIAVGVPFLLGVIKSKMSGSRSSSKMIDTEFRNEWGRKIRITVDDDTHGIHPGMKVTIEGPRGTGSWHLTNVEAGKLANILHQYLYQK